MAPPDRKGGGGLSLRTLAIASAASLTAATVTSRIFPPGTIYASALTPVIVAAVSEMLNRPAQRVSELRRQRRTIVAEARRFETARILGEQGSPLAGAPEFARGAAADEELFPAAPRNGNGTGNGHGSEAPISFHRTRRRRILHPKVWIATGLAAFLIAVAVLTLPELIFGGALATSHRTTFFGGSDSGSSETTHTTTSTSTTTTQQKPATVTQTVPAQTPQSTQTQTTTGTTPTSTQTAPSGGAPAPSDTGTSTSPAPSGTAVPPPG